ncbi:potassium-transporting ATPase subunit F [Devosia sp.]
MTLELGLGLLTAAAILIYAAVALIRPEKF